MNLLPIGTRVWAAQAACPAIDRPNIAGDGVVDAHIPCSPCWQRHVGNGCHVDRNTYRAVGERCSEPVGYVVTLGHRPIVVMPDDDTVLVVPIADTERSAA